jgi:hypothetical protein
MNLKIKEDEKALEDAYKKLGEAVYQTQEEEIRNRFVNEIAEIANLEKTLDEDKKQLAVFKGMKICPNCGAEQAAEAMNCTVCGINMEEARRIKDEMSARCCTRCGERLDPAAKFCMKCGCPVE